jgi:hypothetical protein
LGTGTGKDRGRIERPDRAEPVKDVRREHRISLRRQPIDHLVRRWPEAERIHEPHDAGHRLIASIGRGTREVRVGFTVGSLDYELSSVHRARFYKTVHFFDAALGARGSSHNGGGISAHYFNGNQATPGVPANGTNKFLIEYECWRGETSDKSPGVLNLYIYHPAQRSNYGDHFFTSGLVSPNTSIPFDFGSTFVSRPDITPDLGRWYEYEVMLKANTPNAKDGRVTLWLDGKVIGDFPNLELRTIDTLKIDRFNLSLHAGSNPNGPTKKWYDNVVAAKSYIGPMLPN